MWIFVTIVLVYSSPMFSNALCQLYTNDMHLYCQNSSYEEYKYYIRNEVKKPISYLLFMDTRITSLNNTFFDFEQVKDLKGILTQYCSIEKVEAFTFSKLKNLQSVEFQHNAVPLEISPNALIGLDSLEKFFAVSCEITRIEIGTFAGLPKLQEIVMSRNNITTLKTRTFLGATNVTKVWLQESQISHIEPNAFYDLDNVFELNLAGNKLQNLPLGVFQDLPKLKELKLSNNALDDLNFEELAGLSELEYIDISRNDIDILNVTDDHKYTPKLKQIKIQ